jgi:hypothetical protein
MCEDEYNLPTVEDCWRWLERIDEQLEREQNNQYRRSLTAKRLWFEEQLPRALAREGYPVGITTRGA